MHVEASEHHDLKSSVFLYLLIEMRRMIGRRVGGRIWRTGALPLLLYKNCSPAQGLDMLNHETSILDQHKARDINSNLKTRLMIAR